jgi:TPR repeat protein
MQDRAREGLTAYDLGDYKAAFSILRPIAPMGDDQVQVAVGYMYDHGLGVEQDQAQAAQWYARAAEKGSAAAKYNLAVFYEKGYGTGRGVERDDGEAVRWYIKAAAQGHMLAQYNLGTMYEDGEGVEKNLAEAMKWYRLAANQGHEDAQQRLKELTPKRST